MKLLKKETMRGLWGKIIMRKGKEYYIGKMSYGDYFLEPHPLLKEGELEGFETGTIWIPKDKLS